MTQTDRVIYFEFIIFGGLLGIASVVLHLSDSNMALMSNTFATISGVLLGLFFVVQTNQKERDFLVTQLLLFSILVSLASSLFSLDQSGPSIVSPLTKWVIFVVSALTFEISTVFFVIRTQMLGPIARKKKG